MAASNTLRWGILGTGMIAKKFAADLPQSDFGKLSVTGSRSIESAQDFAAEFGGRAVAGYEALISHDEVDAVYLALPNGLHKEWAIAAMRAGKHVLCEKPIALNAEDAEAMFAVAEETGRTLIEAFMYRAHPQTERLIEMVHLGAIGKLRLMRSNFTFSRQVSDGDARYSPDQGGGALMDVGCYCIHLARQLAGCEPSEVRAIAHKHPMGVDEYAAGLLKFGDNDDFLMTFTCGMTVASDSGTHIAGSGGRIAIDRFWFCDDGFEVIAADGDAEKIHESDTRPVYALEADAFAAAVWGDADPWITAQDSIGNMRVLDALRESAGIPVPD